MSVTSAPGDTISSFDFCEHTHNIHTKINLYKEEKKLVGNRSFWISPGKPWNLCWPGHIYTPKNVSIHSVLYQHYATKALTLMSPTLICSHTDQYSLLHLLTSPMSLMLTVIPPFAIAVPDYPVPMCTQSSWHTFPWKIYYHSGLGLTHDHNCYFLSNRQVQN